MNYFYLLENPEVFQGENKLKYKKCYFEGWYFKNTRKDISISFIPGIHIENGEKSAFIQIITNSSSYYISYSFNDFQFSYDPFFISIGNNFFSLEKIKIDIQDKNISINGELYYDNHIKIERNFFSPNIIGPFSFFPFMECNHAILSMKHEITGFLIINDKKYDFNSGIGYIEKDWGSSFPTSYIWTQANNFQNKNASFFLSVATIPLSRFSFTGFICDFILDNKEYRFATYNSSKLIKLKVSKNNFNIKLKNKDFTLHIYSNNKNSFSLKAPRCGAMQKEIFESIDSNVYVYLSQKENILFEGESKNAGLEIVL